MGRLAVLDGQAPFEQPSHDTLQRYVYTSWGEPRYIGERYIPPISPEAWDLYLDLQEKAERSSLTKPYGNHLPLGNNDLTAWWYTLALWAESVYDPEIRSIELRCASDRPHGPLTVLLNGSVRVPLAGCKQGDMPFIGACVEAAVVADDKRRLDPQQPMPEAVIMHNIDSGSLVLIASETNPGILNTLRLVRY